MPNNQEPLPPGDYTIKPTSFNSSRVVAVVTEGSFRGTKLFIPPHIFFKNKYCARVEKVTEGELVINHVSKVEEEKE